MGLFGGVNSETFICVKPIPIDLVESTPLGLKPQGLSFGREHQTALNRMKSIPVAPHRGLFLLQLSTPPGLKYSFHAKI